MESQEQNKENSQQPVKAEYLTPLSIVVAGVVIAGALFFGLKGQQEGGIQKNPTSGDVKPIVAGEAVEVDLGTNPIKGQNNAPITIVEFSDYQCPFCGRFFAQTEPQILKNYVDTGKAKFTYRDFAFLDGFVGQERGESHLAAEAARCAQDQGKYWEYHDLLFRNQDGENKGAFSADNLKKLANQIGLNAGQFSQCLDGGKYKDLVVADTQAGARFGVNGTPTVFMGRGGILINPSVIQDSVRAGQRIVKFENGSVAIVGALPYSEFEQVLEELLKQN
ncbi:hypothetical protein C4553_02885 [Candidatus Parcubacteria bacterium]|nr:MAG: hypothetical protein C4553_02885 [Candidatus Parcubacteria bacterium]